MSLKQKVKHIHETLLTIPLVQMVTTSSTWKKNRPNFSQGVSCSIAKIPISWRITGWYSIFLLLMMFFLATFIMQFMALWEDSEIRSNLQEQAIKASDNPQKFKGFNDGVYSMIYSPTGFVTRGVVPDGFPLNVKPSPNTISELKVGNVTYYYYDAPYHTPVFSGFVRSVVPVNAMTRKTNSIIFAFLCGGITFIIIATLGGYILIRRGLRPLRVMTQTAAEIGHSRDLSKRLPEVCGNDEIHTLGDTFNSMLNSLEKASYRERQFSSDVSHELRTPIAVIQAESDYGRNYIASIEEAKESFSHIFMQSKFMTSMVTQLLKLARLDKLNALDKEVFSMSHLLTDVVKDYHIIGEKRGITITSHIQDDLTIEGNPLLLRRAVGNLIDNALKFTTSNIDITLTKLEPLGVRIMVTDNGPGIAPEELSKIWNRMYQSESSRNKTSNNGLGLGLYFVSNVVELHGGKAYAESVPCEKTTFSIELYS